MSAQMGFFDRSDRLQQLSDKGDPLERIDAVIDFELFRAELERVVPRSDRSRGGRPPFDHVLMFKLLVIQSLYNLSDEQIEYQVKDRLSFMRFLGLELGDRVPDANTVWTFREQLTKAGAIEALFKLFDAALKSAGYLAMSGQIVDASVVQAPRQRFTDDEKAKLEAGEVPEDWSYAKRSQKDLDGRWTLKRGRKRRRRPGQRQAAEIAVPEYGYKSHVNIDRRHGFVRQWAVSDAAEHDSRKFRELLDKDNTASRVWADTAYRSDKHERHLARHGFASKVHFRKPKGRAMNRVRAKANAARSRVRSSVEHVFAAQKHRMGLFVRTIGLTRATTKIGLANLVYNFTRFAWWEKQVATA